jgi:transcription elongation factor GreA
MDPMIDTSTCPARSIDGRRHSNPRGYDVRSSTRPTLAMTAHGVAALRRDLERLREERDREVPQRLRAACVTGATIGNDEYLAIKEDEAVLSARIATLEDLLRRATVVDPAIDGGGVVGIGSSVSVEFIASGAKGCYRIVGAHESLEAGTASTASPLGRALLGQEPGTVVEFELPNGRAQRLLITATRAPKSRQPRSRLPLPTGDDDGLAA